MAKIGLEWMEGGKKRIRVHKNDLLKKIKLEKKTNGL